jgi:hypothetical protein
LLINWKSVVVLMVLISGCQTMVPVTGTDESGLRVSISVGDTVRVLTKFGDRETFEVIEITEDTLIGKDHSIRYQDMAFVEKRSTNAVVGNTLAVALLVVGGAVVFDGLSGLGPPPG